MEDLIWSFSVTNARPPARPNLAPTPLYNLLTNENLALPGWAVTQLQMVAGPNLSIESSVWSQTPAWQHLLSSSKAWCNYLTQQEYSGIISCNLVTYQSMVKLLN